MENSVKFYQRCIKELLKEYAEIASGEARLELLFDDDHARYMLARVGWRQEKRIHRCLVHIDIEGNCVIIQANNTEQLIDRDLVNKGIPSDKIRLGFLPEAAYQYAIQANMVQPAA